MKIKNLRYAGVISLIILFAASGLNATTQEVSLKKLKEVELVFNGVTLDNISFYPKNDLVIKYDKHENVKIESKENKVYLSSEDEAEIKLYLPESKTYIYNFKKNEDVICKFNSERLVVLDKGEEIVKYKDGEFLVYNREDSTKVKINKDGIWVSDNEDNITIDSEGIIIQGEDENISLTGFWGKLLSGFIKVVVKTSISAVADTPEKVAKSIINSDLNENIEIEIDGDNAK